MSSSTAKPRAKKTAAAAAAAVTQTQTQTQTQMPVLEVKEETVAPPTAPAQAEAPAAAPTAAQKKPRVSNKKTPPVVAFVSPAGITGSFLTQQRPLIAHLPISSADLSFEASNLVKPENSSAVPVAFDDTQKEMSYLETVPEGDTTMPTPAQAFAQVTPQQTNTSEPKCRLPNHYSEKLMVLFQDNNRYQKLPEKTEIACFWCCHSFTSQPVALPSHILDEVWSMYGNFCSPECATAYLFKERIDANVQWERYALLNSLYAEDAEVPVGSPRGIRPAPPREVLRMFGGSMDIREYRALVHEKRLRVDVLTPPMVSIIQTMDTKPIDFYDQNLKNVFIRNDIQHKYNAPGAQGLRLRRTKPVKNRESTVDWAMQTGTGAAIAAE